MGTHLEELGRRGHPGRLRGSPRTGCRLRFTCCASAARYTGPRSARQPRLPAAAGRPADHRAQAGRENGHEAKPQTPVSGLPAPPAPLPLSPPRRRKWSRAHPGGCWEGPARSRAAGGLQKGSPRERVRKRDPCGPPSRKWALEKEGSWSGGDEFMRN